MIALSDKAMTEWQAVSRVPHPAVFRVRFLYLWIGKLYPFNIFRRVSTSLRPVVMEFSEYFHLS